MGRYSCLHSETEALC
ncbi:hypothetical protein LINPERHAP2_LOCUS40273 [Linum perenne]